MSEAKERKGARDGRASGPRTPRKPPLYGIGARPATPRERPERRLQGMEDWEVWDESRQRAGILRGRMENGKDHEMSGNKQVQTDRWVKGRGSHLFRMASKNLFWAFAAWRQGVAILRLQRTCSDGSEVQKDLIQKNTQLQEELQALLHCQGEELLTASRSIGSAEAACHGLLEEMLTAREEAQAAQRERDVVLEQLQQTDRLQHGFSRHGELERELQLLREELETTRICEAENAQAECAILRAVREEIAVQRHQDQKDLSSFKHELQAEQAASDELRQKLQKLRCLAADAASPVSPTAPRQNEAASLRTILKLHSELPQTIDSEKALNEAAELREKCKALRDAEERCNALSDEMRVQDIMCRRLRLDEEHFQREENQLAEQLLAERLGHQRNEADVFYLQEALKEARCEQDELEAAHAQLAQAAAERRQSYEEVREAESRRLQELWSPLVCVGPQELDSKTRGSKSTGEKMGKVWKSLLQANGIYMDVCFEVSGVWSVISAKAEREPVATGRAKWSESLRSSGLTYFQLCKGGHIGHHMSSCALVTVAAREVWSQRRGKNIHSPTDGLTNVIRLVWHLKSKGIAEGFKMPGWKDRGRAWGNEAATELLWYVF